MHSINILYTGSYKRISIYYGQWVKIFKVYFNMFALNEINVSQLCKNVFTVNNDSIVLTFHEQDLTKGCGRGLHRPSLTRGPYPASDFSNGQGRQMKGDFPNGPGRQLRGEFSNGPGRAGK